MHQNPSKSFLCTYEDQTAVKYNVFITLYCRAYIAKLLGL